MTLARNNNIDPQIIEGCKNNESACLKRLYDCTVDKLYNVVFRIVLDKHSTQDVLQDSYLKIFAKIHQYDVAKGGIYGWMCKIAINQSINYIRPKRLVFDDVSTLEIVEKEVSILQSLEAEYILQLLQQLPEQHRIIFNLYEIEGYNHEEIAALLNININSSRVYLSRSKSKLQELIRESLNYHHSKTVP